MITEYRVPGSDGGEFVLFVPTGAGFPVALLADPAFFNGCVWGYEQSFLEEDETWTPLQVTNWLFQGLAGKPYDADEAAYSWYVGFLLGGLSSLAHRDRLLALVGMAHLCFLLVHIPAAVGEAYAQACSDASCLHNEVLGIYRARVREWKAQGVDTWDAFRLALGEVHLWQR